MIWFIGRNRSGLTMQQLTFYDGDHLSLEFPATLAKILGSLQGDQTPLISLSLCSNPLQVDSVHPNTTHRSIINHHLNSNKE